MDSNNIVNNLFSDNINIPVQDFIKDLGAPIQQISYTYKSLVPTYIALKTINKDLLVNINNSITEEDVDDYINSNLQDKIYLQSDDYYTEVITTIYNRQQCETSLEKVLDYFYNKPIKMLLLANIKGFDEIINTYNSMLFMLAKEYKLPKSRSGINYNRLFNNDIGSCIEYYIQVCEGMNIVADLNKFNELVQYVNNAKIDTLLGHESENIKDILKICYESKA